jgi:hypothetical protein
MCGLFAFGGYTMTTCPRFTVTVNGTAFEFALLCNSHEFYAPDGVIVLPGMNISHPDFPEALREAHFTFPYHRAMAWIYELKYPFSGQYSIQADLIVEAFEKQIVRVDFDTYVKAKNFQNDVYDYPPSAKASKPNRKQSRAGFVYLLKSETGHYKIGRTIDPKSRSKTFGIQLPFAVEFLAVIPADDMISLESELHRRFDEKRLSGEWFNLSDDDIEYIKGLAS